MTDHSTTESPDFTDVEARRARIARFARVALASSVLPAALWASTGTAAADPGPLQITGDGCIVSFTGEGYGRLELRMTHEGHTAPLLSTTMTGGSSEYGVEWLLPLGDTATFTVDGIVADTVVASASVEMGSCTTPYDESITITVTEEGAPAAGSMYDIQLLDCSVGVDFAPIVRLAAGESAEIPVFPQRTYCPTPVGQPATVTSLTVSSPSLSTGYGGHPVVNVHAVHTAPPVEEPPAEEPPAEEPPAEEPPAEEPPAEEPPAEEPPAEEPPAEEPPAEEPTAPTSPAAPAAPTPKPDVAPPAAVAPVAPVPAATQVEAGAEERDTERDALPRTGGDDLLAPAGLLLAAAGAVVLRARRWVAGS